MSNNQKQPAAGGPQTQRYSSSPYQPIVPPPNSYTGSDTYHNPATSYVQQTQGPNQGPGLRIQPTGPPSNPPSTPPNTDLKVSSIPGQIPQMPFQVSNAVRAQGPYYPRGTGGPPTQPTRMPNHQQRAQAPHQMYPQTLQYPMYLMTQSPPSMYYTNQRPNQNLMASTFSPQVYTQSIGYAPYSAPTSAPVPYQQVASYSMPPAMFQPPAGSMALSRTSVPSAAPAPSSSSSGTLPNPTLMAQPGHNQKGGKQRPSRAIAIIDPVTGGDILNEIYDLNSSNPASGESSSRQTPKPDKEVQADFAKRVAMKAAEGSNEERQHSSLVEHQSSALQHENLISEPYHSGPPSIQPVLHPRYDIQNSTLQCDAKEFVSAASKPIIKEATPIVSANSDAIEVILPKKEPVSPAKNRKQSKHEPKQEAPKEFQEKECDMSSSIVKEEIISPVPDSNVVIPVPIPEPSPQVNKEILKENNSDKKSVAKKPTPLEPKKPEPEVQVPQPPAPLEATSNTGKSKSSRKNAHNQNGKPQPPAAPQQPQPSVPVPAPQPPKAHNKSNKTKELNMKGANKEGTDMDAFNDNNAAVNEVNANVVHQTENNKVVSNNVNNVNANQIPQPDVVAPVETETVISEQIKQKDDNENVTVTSEPVTTIPPVATATPTITKPIFDVTSIVKESTPATIALPISDNRDELDRAIPFDNLVAAKNEVNNKVGGLKSLNENSVNDRPALPYKPGQWAPDKPDGKKVYERDFLMALRAVAASHQKPDNIPENVLQDDRNRPLDARSVSMGGKTDFMNPPFLNYGGKSGSQRGPLPKRNSQSKMGSRGGDKSGKPQPKVSISLTRDVKLHETENAWKPTRLQRSEIEKDEDKKTEVLYKKVRSVLNKLTPQKFDTLVKQVGQLEINSKERLEGVIDLVFKKAIDEPNFALAYAMMCKEIQSMQVNIESGDKKNLMFRTVLIGRCQSEFEKHSKNETDRNKIIEEIDACTDPEKKKEWEFELEEHDRRLRMKSVGTIRFIGELFKQNMLTANIMKRCLQNLLDNKDEESLECLCKLLSTVGKELESKNNDLTSIFDEMKKITEGKRQKVSSRIRFMLQDVIDLRDSKWIPRRGDLNPKTIDQIQKEAETEQLNIQVMNMQPPSRKDDRGGGGPRGGPRKNVSEDGWNSVGPRNNRNQPFSIQTDKLKAKFPLADEPLGSSTMFGNWSKGAGGAKIQTPINTNSNIFSALDNLDMDKRSFNSRGSKDPYNSKGPSMERNSYKNYDGRGSRSGSQHRDTPMRSTGPPPSNQMMPPQAMGRMSSTQSYQPPSMHVPSAPIPQPVPKLSEDQIERRLKNSLEEYINGCCTTTEYYQDISSTVPPSDYSKVVYESYNCILEKSHAARLKTGELFAKLLKSGHFLVDDFIKGFSELLEVWEDLVIDIPQIWEFFAEDLVSLVLEEVLPFSKLQNMLEILIQPNVAKKLLKHLFALIIKEKGPNFLQQSWQNSKVNLSDFMPESEVEAFVKECKVEFLLGGNVPVGSNSLSYEDIQQKLSEFLASKTSRDDIASWISANVGDRVKENKFIRALATAVFENSIHNNKLQPEVLSSHTNLLQKYVDHNGEYELQCLYALQALIHKLEHPSGLLLTICDQLYEDSTFCQESFIAWEESNDPAETEGKGIAIKQLTSFFTQLRENEEDDEYSSSEDAA